MSKWKEEIKTVCIKHVFQYASAWGIVGTFYSFGFLGACHLAPK